MSSQPPPRRRRIAGERRRPLVDDTESVTSDQSDTAGDVRTDASSGPATADTLVPPPPPSAAEPVEKPVKEQIGKKSRPRSRPFPRGVPRPGPLDMVFGALALLGVGLIAVLLLGLPQAPVRALGLPGVPDLRDVVEAEQAQAAAESAPSVAERAAGAILAYDYRNLDADQDAAQRFMTPSFAEEYATTFDKSVQPAARTYRAQVTSEVQGASVVRASPDRVRVLLFVDQTTRSTAREGPQLALNRVEFDMVLRDGDWLVDGISSY